MKTYRGARTDGRCNVTVESVGPEGRAGWPPSPRHDLWNHSPSGFEWGHGGSGPAQLALAILADHLGNDARASRLHQPFKWKIVGGLDRGGWTLTTNQVQEVIDEIEAERPAFVEEETP